MVLGYLGGMLFLGLLLGGVLLLVSGGLIALALYFIAKPLAYKSGWSLPEIKKFLNRFWKLHLLAGFILFRLFFTPYESDFSTSPFAKPSVIEVAFWHMQHDDFPEGFISFAAFLLLVLALTLAVVAVGWRWINQQRHYLKPFLYLLLAITIYKFGLLLFHLIAYKAGNSIIPVQVAHRGLYAIADPYLQQGNVAGASILFVALLLLVSLMAGLLAVGWRWVNNKGYSLKPFLVALLGLSLIRMCIAYLMNIFDYW